MELCADCVFQIRGSAGDGERTLCCFVREPSGHADRLLSGYAVFERESSGHFYLTTDIEISVTDNGHAHLGKPNVARSQTLREILLQILGGVPSDLQDCQSPLAGVRIPS